MYRISCVLLAAAVVTAGLAAAKDYATLPPKPADAAAMLRAQKVSLAKAIELAEKAAGGVAASAVSDVLSGAKSIEVIVYAADARHRVTVDAASGEVTANEAVARFPGAAVSGEWTETPSGLKYYDMVVGTGTQPANLNAKVKVHYTGWLLDGTKFDSSVDRNQPIDFPLNRVIKGWGEGVGSMKVGGKRKLIIPYQLGYGERGMGADIPPKATLVFDVELLDVMSDQPAPVPPAPGGGS